MPKRKRRDLRAAAAAAAAEHPVVDPQIALFARRHQAERQQAKDAKRARAEARLREQEHARLTTAKDGAAAKLKAVRRKERIGPGEVEVAEAAYRVALGELVAFETGAPPTWAATEEAEPDPEESSEPAEREPEEPEPGREAD